MSASKHTPGPWVLDERYPGYVYCDDVLGSAVATCRDGLVSHVAHRDYVANANLIAAAPDLYAACKDISDFLRLHGFDRTLVDAALAKAEGRGA